MNLWREVLDVLVSFVLSCLITATVCDFFSAWSNIGTRKDPSRRKNGGRRR